MLIIQSILVYGFITWIMTVYGIRLYKYQYPQGINGVNRLEHKKLGPIRMLSRSNFIIPIFVFCLFAAIRYKVGVDCEGYKDIFYHYLTGFDIYQLSDKKEYGFEALIFIASKIFNSHYFYFSVLAFLQIFPLYYALRNQRYIIPFLGIAIMLTEMYLSLMNGMRQNIAACMFVAMVPYIVDKKWCKSSIILLIAILFHKSALLLLPLGIGVLLIKDRFLDYRIQFILLLTCYLLMDKVSIDLLQFAKFADSAGYSERAIETYASYIGKDKSFSIVMYLHYAIYMMVIYYSKQLKIMYNSSCFNAFYNLFFIGICLHLVFYNDFTMGRLLYYLRIFSPIIVSALLFYLWNVKSKVSKHNFWFVILLLITHLLWILYKASIAYPNEYTLYKFDLFY